CIELTVDLINIQDSYKVATKERPPKHRYISSIEKKQARSSNSTCRFYKYHTCGQLGHNSIFYKRDIDS
ncbi:35947_t:CDS:1, partial [Racocetra persica]